MRPEIDARERDVELPVKRLTVKKEVPVRTVLGSSRLLVILILVLSSCGERSHSPMSIHSPSTPLDLASKGKGGGGGNTQVEFSLSGGYESDPIFQSAVIVNDNKKRLQIEGGGGEPEPLWGAKYFAMDFADKVGICVKDPVDMDAATYAELIGQLSDPLQNRTFYALVDKSGSPVSAVESVYHEGGTLAGQKYWTKVYDASAVEGPQDRFTLTGGNFWISKGGTPASLLCPFTGALVLTVQH